MAASKKLVYLPKVKSNTWLLMTKLKQGACLRDYSSSPPTSNRMYSADALEALLSQDGNYSERLPAFSHIPYTDATFWHDQIEFRNAESGLSSSIDERRLQDRFKEECNGVLANRSDAALRAVFERWVERFQCIKEKDQYNHWDNDVAESKFSATKGIGWTSQLLEASRRNGEVHFIPTGCDLTDFSLVAMELGFGISSKNNRFCPHQTDFIKPDGLALRKNGYFTVVEVKGPKDEAGLIGPLLQATCATLALVAKRQMIQKIALLKGKLRPAHSRAEIPQQRRSLGIHILSQAGKDGGPRKPWTQEVERTCKAVINAFSHLEYIAYSFVTTDEAKDLKCLKIDFLVTTEGAKRLERPTL